MAFHRKKEIGFCRKGKEKRKKKEKVKRRRKTETREKKREEKKERTGKGTGLPHQGQLSIKVDGFAGLWFNQVSP